MKEALFYKKLDNNIVQCRLCNHLCVIQPKKRGFCGVRENNSGTLYTLVFNKLIAAHVDPIEKKPLYHFLPGSNIFSVATPGCNFRCSFCQNYNISQFPTSQASDNIPGDELTPQQIVATAQKHNCRSIAYTYTEPTIFFEYAYETAKLAKENNLYNTFVTNGYMTSEVLEQITPYLHAANIDLKSFREEFYHKHCQAQLKPVLTNIAKMNKLGIWIEITTLIIPTLNDSTRELQQIAEFISSIDPAIPWHISRFYPCYQLQNVPPTPPETIEKAWEIGIKAGLKYVYTGNSYGISPGTTTYCPGCKKELIKRQGFDIVENIVRKGECPHCRTKIDGFGMV